MFLVKIWFYSVTCRCEMSTRFHKLPALNLCMRVTQSDERDEQRVNQSNFNQQPYFPS